MTDAMNTTLGAAKASPLPAFDENTCEEDIERMMENATNAANFLKALGHEGRLMILCHLGGGERSVGELETLLGMRQAAVSQMLARLRDEGFVSTRRDGKTVYYRLADERITSVINLLYGLFCKPSE